MMKITLCSSASFFDKLNNIKKSLESREYEVFLLSMEDFGEENAWSKVELNLIRKHFEKINKSNAIFVANFEKNKIQGYICGNSFLEMGKAFDKGIPILLLNPISSDSSYIDELFFLKPIVTGTNFDKIGDVC